MLRQLPIYEAGSLPGGDASPVSGELGDRPGEAGQPARAPPAVSSHEPIFVDLQSQRYLAPPGYARELLGDSFIVSEAAKEVQVLVKYLDIPQLDRATFLQQHLFPSVATLPAAARDEAFLRLLGSLADLRRSDPETVEQLQQVRQADSTRACP